ncbi:MAG: hypothetical protein WBP03_04105 [Candidatus Saccharimonadales bacterium]
MRGFRSLSHVEFVAGFLKLTTDFRAPVILNLFQDPCQAQYVRYGETHGFRIKPGSDKHRVILNVFQDLACISSGLQPMGSRIKVWER